MQATRLCSRTVYKCQCTAAITAVISTMWSEPVVSLSLEFYCQRQSMDNIVRTYYIIRGLTVEASVRSEQCRGAKVQIAYLYVAK